MRFWGITAPPPQPLGRGAAGLGVGCSAILHPAFPDNALALPDIDELLIIPGFYLLKDPLSFLDHVNKTAMESRGPGGLH